MREVGAFDIKAGGVPGATPQWTSTLGLRWLRDEFRWLDRITWTDAFALQERLVEQRLAGEIEDTVLLLEHEPVITIGRTPDRPAC